MDLTLFYSAGAGLLIGAGLSVILNVYNKSTASKYSYSIFGVNSMDLIINVTMFSLALAIAILSGYSVLARDLSYPRAHPITFTFETLLMATLCSIVIFPMAILRKHSIDSIVALEFLALFVKFGLLHILLQFSGIYSEIFPYRK
jgi:hypothetical protein